MPPGTLALVTMQQVHCCPAHIPIDASAFASSVLLSCAQEFTYCSIPCWAERNCGVIQELIHLAQRIILPAPLGHEKLMLRLFLPYSHFPSEHHQRGARPVCIQFRQIYLGAL